MPPALSDTEEEYSSADDSDFAPDEAPAGQSMPSDAESEDETAEATPATKKRKRQEGDDAEDLGFENSGDEAIISKGKKRQKKGSKGKAATAGATAEDGEDGGNGSLIKTRSMRAAAKVERKVAVSSGPVTVDVDSLWEQMIAGPVLASPSGPKAKEPTGSARETTNIEMSETVPPKSRIDEPSMIRIKRTYNFAGKVHSEEKLVPRDSAEAQLYLASNPEAALLDPTIADDDQNSPKRLPRRAFRSAFEPVLEPGASRRADLDLGVAVRMRARGEQRGNKLSTVEKSRMDWAGFVDKEGIRDELALAGRSKGNFSAREDFLARSEARREEEARKARVAAKT